MKQNNVLNLVPQIPYDDRADHNIFFNWDSYKVGMWKMYPPGTTEVYSFIESRGGELNEIVATGVKQFIHQYLSKPLTQQDVDDLDVFFKLRPESFSKANVQAIVDKHNGYLPLHIRTVPEGTVIPVGTPFVVVSNTDEEAYWLTTAVETNLLSFVWSMVSVATLAREFKKKIKYWNDKTSPGFGDGLDWQLHNFGDRGAKPGFAKYAGLAHMISFNGNDCIAGTKYVFDTYKDKDRLFGYSIPASEHTISSSWGPDREKEYALNMIAQFKDEHPAISIVADTYNVYEFVKMVVTDPDILAALKELADMGKKIVIRPDSGSFDEVLPKLLNTVADAMGYTVNELGLKILPPGIGFIWSDGNTLDNIDEIYKVVEDNGWASQNLVIGVGGFLVDSMMRDSQKFAMKGSNVIINGESIGICKSPITAAWKKSKKGKFSVIKNGDTYSWKPYEEGDPCVMETVYYNGLVPEVESFQAVKDRAAV